MTAKEETQDDIQVIRGWTFPSGQWFSRKNIEDIMEYVPEDGDIIIASYPKTGTTWMQYIVLQILSKGESFPSFYDAAFKIVPFLEMSGMESLKSLGKPRIYKHHLPYHLVPKNPKAKYIYTYRNPEDTLVSFYHFSIQVSGQKIEFDKFFENFLMGNIGYGNYVEHVLTFYEHREDENLLLVSYEKLSRNRKEELLRIAKFLGEEHYDYLQRNEAVLEKIMKQTSFDYMKKNLFVMRPGVSQEGRKPEDKPEKINFFRKGTVGDGKQTLSPEQLSRLGEMANKIAKGTEIYEEWIKG